MTKACYAFFLPRLSPINKALILFLINAYLHIPVIAISAYSDINCSTLTPDQGFSIIGAASQDNLGIGMSRAGDVNGDGVDDIMLGALGTSSCTGTVYVLFGRNGQLNDIKLSTTDLYTSHQGFKIIGESSFNLLGSAANFAGDFNGDGIDDLILGAYGYLGSIGEAYIIFGRRSGFTDIDLNTASLSTSQQGFKITGVASTYFGYQVSSIGDVNHDGFDDVIIGSLGTTDNKGYCHVLFGNNNGLADINLATTDLAGQGRGFKITGRSGDKIGSSLPSHGDINHDGIDDIVIGAQGDSANSNGAVYVIYGRASGFTDIDFGSVTLSTNHQGFEITGADGKELGLSVASSVDVNHDGVDDIIIGDTGNVLRCIW